jgi:hypothetical protein
MGVTAKLMYIGTFIEDRRIVCGLSIFPGDSFKFTIRRKFANLHQKCEKVLHFLRQLVIISVIILRNISRDILRWITGITNSARPGKGMKNAKVRRKTVFDSNTYLHWDHYFGVHSIIACSWNALRDDF